VALATPLNFYVEPQKAWYGVSALARSVSYLLIGVAATALLGAIWMIVLSLRARVQEDRESRHQREDRDSTSPNRSVPETSPGVTEIITRPLAEWLLGPCPRRLSNYRLLDIAVRVARDLIAGLRHTKRKSSHPDDTPPANRPNGPATHTHRLGISLAPADLSWRERVGREIAGLFIDLE